MSQGKFVAALQRYRNTLCAVEAQSISAIRLKFMCQMAELLIQGLAGEEYQPPINSTVKNSIWKPKQYASLNQVKLKKMYVKSTVQYTGNPKSTLGVSRSS